MSVIDEIANKAIIFKVGNYIGSEEQYIRSGEYHLGILNPGDEVSLSKLLLLYEDDEDKVTISFSTFGMSEFVAAIRFYDNDDIVGELRLESDMSFDKALTRYCGEM